MPQNIVKKVSIYGVSLTHQCFSISVWYVVTLNSNARVGDPTYCIYKLSPFFNQIFF